MSSVLSCKVWAKIEGGIDCPANHSAGFPFGPCYCFLAWKFILPSGRDWRFWLAFGQGTAFSARKSATVFFEFPYRILPMALHWFPTGKQEQSGCADLCWGLQAAQAFFHRYHGDREKFRQAAKAELTSLGSIPRCFGTSTVLGFGHIWHLIQSASSWNWKSSVLATHVSEVWKVVVSIVLAIISLEVILCSWLVIIHPHKSFREEKIWGFLL